MALALICAVDDKETEYAFVQPHLGRGTIDPPTRLWPRKNYLFVGSERGVHAAATIYSIIETAKVNGRELFGYIADLLTRQPGHKINRVADLLPFRLPK